MGEVATTWYAIYDDGSIEMFETEQLGVTPVLARPGRFVTEEEYLAEVARMEAASAAWAAEQDAAAQAQRKDDYDVLIALGIPDATARRMSGYTGP